MVDGVSDIDTGCSNCFTHFEPNIDSIAEVKVLTSNYQAEFGRNAGGSVQVVAFAEPAVGTIGNAGGGSGIIYGPGFVNFDASLSRSIPLGTERRLLKLRLEAFNVFNHTEFSGVNTTFTYDATGKNTVSSTGQYTSDRGPRILTLELRFQF